MSLFLLIAGVALPGLALAAFMLSRRKVRTGPANNWRNEAYLARIDANSWSESECAPGREGRAPPPVMF